MVSEQDKLITSWLLASIIECVLVGVAGLTSTNEIWETLESSFSSQSRAKVMQLKFQLQTLWKENMTMKDYLNTIKACCDLLGAIGEQIYDDNQILYILTGLDQEYNALIVFLTSRVEHCTLREVKALLLSYENRLEMVELTNPDNSGRTGSNTGQHGSDSTNSRGHFSNGQYPLSANMANISSTQNQNNFPLEMNWYPNFGASNHVTNDFSNLNMASDYQSSESLQIGNGTGLEIVHIGDSILKSPSHPSYAFVLKPLFPTPSPSPQQSSDISTISTQSSISPLSVTPTETTCFESALSISLVLLPTMYLLSSLQLTQMLIGPLTKMIANRHQRFVSLSVVILSYDVLRNNLMFRVRAQRRSFEVLLQRLVMSYGYIRYSLNFIFHFRSRLLFGLTI
ncbi:hypothetical protein C2S52_009473 [Perilla frutescens var. hirtella]|nr:hypothetical protein C2S52_009473 [Perilla frutescens var. hirtella]